MSSVRTVKGWLELPTKPLSVAQRWDVLRNWVMGNGLLDSVPNTNKLSDQEKAVVRKRVDITGNIASENIRRIV